MNKAILIGRLASDPEGRTTASGVSNATFRIAVNRDYANQEGVREADFLPVVCWRHTADYVRKYLHKGDRAAIDGRIQTRSYDAQDGTKRYVTEIVAERVESLGGKREDTQQPGAEAYTPVEDDSDLPF